MGGEDEDATIEPSGLELTMDELRVVTRYAVESTEDVLTIFEQYHPDDRRPRAAGPSSAVPAAPSCSV